VPVDVRCESAVARRYVERLRADADALLRANGLGDCELSILIAGNGRVRSLNRDYRGRDRVTDVLAFAQDEAAAAAAARAAAAAASSGPHRRATATARAQVRSPLPLGDVVISIDTARRQAVADGIATGERLRALLVHGFLHLLGYDHERSAAAARRMFARERELAAELARRKPGRRRQ